MHGEKDTHETPAHSSESQWQGRLGQVSQMYFLVPSRFYFKLSSIKDSATEMFSVMLWEGKHRCNSFHLIMPEHQTQATVSMAPYLSGVCGEQLKALGSGRTMKQVCVLVWEETGVPGGNPSEHGENAKKNGLNS